MPNCPGRRPGLYSTVLGVRVPVGDDHVACTPSEQPCGAPSESGQPTSWCSVMPVAPVVREHGSSRSGRSSRSGPLRLTLRLLTFGGCSLLVLVGLARGTVGTDSRVNRRRRRRPDG